MLVACRGCGCPIQGPTEWVLFLRCDLGTYVYTVVRRQDLSEASYQALLRNGDVILVNPSMSYVCNEMKAVSHAFRHIVPQFEHCIRRALRECAFEPAIFALQRLRLIIFDYFTKFVIRYFVSGAVMANDNWYRHDQVYNFEKVVANDWYEWFENTGAFISSEIGLVAEAKLHFKQVRAIVRYTIV